MEASATWNTPGRDGWHNSNIRPPQPGKTRHSIVQYRPHRERSHVESREGKRHRVLGVGGARRVQQRIVMGGRGMGETAGSGLAEPRERRPIVLGGGGGG